MNRTANLNALQAERILARLTEEGHVLSATSANVNVEVPALLFDEISAWGADNEDAEMDDGYGEAALEQESQYEVETKASRQVVISKAQSQDTLTVVFDEPIDLEQTLSELRRLKVEIARSEKSFEDHMSVIFGEAYHG
jgi:tRNA uridine 5-carbamoylmethylation protein Kti12